MPLFWKKSKGINRQNQKKSKGIIFLIVANQIELLLLFVGRMRSMLTTLD